MGKRWAKAIKTVRRLYVNWAEIEDCVTQASALRFRYDSHIRPNRLSGSNRYGMTERFIFLELIVVRAAELHLASDFEASCFSC
jgi:hypothetical protein